MMHKRNGNQIWKQNYIRKEGIEEGAYKKAIETAENMIKEGIRDIELISRITGLSEEILKDIL